MPPLPAHSFFLVQQNSCPSRFLPKSPVRPTVIQSQIKRGLGAWLNSKRLEHDTARYGFTSVPLELNKLGAAVRQPPVIKSLRGRSPLLPTLAVPVSAALVFAPYIVLV
jgi:hypothetical protein